MARTSEIKVGIVQRAFSNDIELNRIHNQNAVESLAADGAELVVLSELHDSLYFVRPRMWIISVWRRKYQAASQSFIPMWRHPTVWFWSQVCSSAVRRDCITTRP